MQVALVIKKDLYRDYLNHLFEYDPQTKTYQVSRNNDFGKLICSRVRYSALPVKQERDPNSINLVLPKSRPLANAKNHFLFLTKEDQEKLQDELEVLFNIDFDRYYLQGLKLEMMQKDIIQSFIVNRKLVRLIGDNEMLKKRQYREQLENMKILETKLRKQADYRNNLIMNSINLSMGLV